MTEYHMLNKLKERGKIKHIKKRYAKYKKAYIKFQEMKF